MNHQNKFKFVAIFLLILLVVYKMFCKINKVETFRDVDGAKMTISWNAPTNMLINGNNQTTLTQNSTPKSIQDLRYDVNIVHKQFNIDGILLNTYDILSRGEIINTNDITDGTLSDLTTNTTTVTFANSVNSGDTFQVSVFVYFQGSPEDFTKSEKTFVLNGNIVPTYTSNVPLAISATFLINDVVITATEVQV